MINGAARNSPRELINIGIVVTASRQFVAEYGLTADEIKIVGGIISRGGAEGAERGIKPDFNFPEFEGIKITIGV